MVQAHIIYSGTVQGVGFRFTVQRYARTMQLKGWVKNCPDGTVEVCAEGAKDKIEKLCRNVEEYFDGYVRDKKIDFGSADGSFKDFQIIH